MVEMVKVSIPKRITPLVISLADLSGSNKFGSFSSESVCV